MKSMGNNSAEFKNTIEFMSFVDPTGYEADIVANSLLNVNSNSNASASANLDATALVTSSANNASISSYSNINSYNNNSSINNRNKLHLSVVKATNLKEVANRT